MNPSDDPNATQSNQRFVSRLMTLSAVGTEMAVPIVVGVFADLWLGWMPALTIIGAVLGLVGGIYHLVSLNRTRRQ